MNTKYAVYANCTTRNGSDLTLRVGQPVDCHRAQARWLRLDNRHGGFDGETKRPVRIIYMRRMYTVESFEVRSVDYHGRGLGAERHQRAVPVPYRALRSAVR